ncbi:uncharacterized protein LOC141909069 [Tubulanus polymorphus]|uniref:uncharacterized protein LOC141909069 n=1 Tax=Tubulanus polymorphus TaxID=672921 RepID=UPI003DA5FF9E
MDLSVLSSVMEKIVVCLECGRSNTCFSDISKKSGFSHSLVIKCSGKKCSWSETFQTSKSVDIGAPKITGQGRKHMEVNVRMVSAFRNFGQGHRSMFCTLMNMPPPMQPKAYDKIAKEVHDLTGAKVSVKMEYTKNTPKKPNENKFREYKSLKGVLGSKI